MFENLRILYRHYGGLSAMIKSAYFWIAVILTCISYQSVSIFTWIEIALRVLPSLTGFTIISFAIIFSMLTKKQRKAISNNNGPMVKIAAFIGHAVFVQISAILIAIVISTTSYLLDRVGMTMISTLGLFLAYYGVLLVLAAALSIFRMQEIIAKISSSGDEE